MTPSNNFHLTLEDARKQILYSSTSLRGVAILAVIVAHITAQPLSQATYPITWLASLEIALNGAIRFTMPMFFMLSLFSLSINVVKPGKILRFYTNKLPKLIVPYLIYSLFFYWLKIGREQEPFSIMRFVSQLTMGTVEYHLWFIHALILLFIVHPFAYRFYQKNLKEKIGWVVIFGVIQVGFIALMGFANAPDCTWSQNRIIRWLDHPIFRSWWYLFAGYYLYDNADRAISYFRYGKGRWIAQSIVLLTAAAIIGFWESVLTNGTTIGSMRLPFIVHRTLEPLMGAAVLLLLISRTEWTASRFGMWAKSYGFNSCGIYFLHVALLFGSGWLARTVWSISPWDWQFVVVAFLALPVLSLYSTRLLTKIPLVGSYLT